VTEEARRLRAAPVLLLRNGHDEERFTSLWWRWQACWNEAARVDREPFRPKLVRSASRRSRVRRAKFTTHHRDDRYSYAAGGHSGRRLQSREAICRHRGTPCAALYDAIVGLAGCDNRLPDDSMAIAASERAVCVLVWGRSCRAKVPGTGGMCLPNRQAVDLDPCKECSRPSATTRTGSMSQAASRDIGNAVGGRRPVPVVASSRQTL